MLLSTNTFRHYQRCHRRAYLDLKGDHTLKESHNDYRIKLQHDRIHHEQAILESYLQSGLSCFQPDYPPEDWQAGHQATLELMAQGVDLIYHGVLWIESSSLPATPFESFSSSLPTRYSPEVSFLQPIKILAFPDLLIKQPGISKFGDWLYTSADFYLGRRPKSEYQIVATFHAQILAAIQGTFPTKSFLMLRRTNPSYLVLSERYLVQTQAFLKDCVEKIHQDSAPEVFISRQRCNLCPWLNSCYTVAKSQNHLSLLAGITPSRYQGLQTLGIQTVEEIAQADFSQLEDLFGWEISQRMVQQAKCQLSQQALLTFDHSCSLLQTLPNHPIELYFDIEAEPERNLDYLLGVLVIDRTANTQVYHGFLAEDSSQEKAIWQQFLDLVSRYPQAPIFHFCDYEVLTVKRLASLYKTHPKVMTSLLSRFVDIHAWMTETVTLPVESYALKPVAKWLGFEWRDAMANGQLCIYWYDQWLKTGDRNFLELITRYNEDDCQATYYLKDWLVKFSEGSTPSLGMEASSS